MCWATSTSPQTSLSSKTSSRTTRVSTSTPIQSIREGTDLTERHTSASPPNHYLKDPTTLEQILPRNLLGLGSEVHIGLLREYSRLSLVESSKEDPREGVLSPFLASSQNYKDIFANSKQLFDLCQTPSSATFPETNPSDIILVSLSCLNFIIQMRTLRLLLLLSLVSVGLCTICTSTNLGSSNYNLSHLASILPIQGYTVDFCNSIACV